LEDNLPFGSVDGLPAKNWQAWHEQSLGNAWEGLRLLMRPLSGKYGIGRES